jgi:hypothetical protein
VEPKDPSPLPERATLIEAVHAPFNRVSVSSDRSCLVVIYGPELGKRAALGQGSFEIGRSSRCDLPIDQESISRNHARISWDGQRHVIEDLGSTNGTFVNETVVKRTPLKDGDQIKVGRSILKYMSGDNIEANYHEEIYRLMTMDALTQTHNRRYFNEALEREYNRSLRYRRALSLLLFDIDHFKKINDTYGHVAVSLPWWSSRAFVSRTSWHASEARSLPCFCPRSIRQALASPPKRFASSWKPPASSSNRTRNSGAR